MSDDRCPRCAARGAHECVPFTLCADFAIDGVLTATRPDPCGVPNCFVCTGKMRERRAEL